jgi:hypothetical protein
MCCNRKLRMEMYTLISDNNGFIVANFATSRCLTVNCTMFRNPILHKYDGNSPVGKCRSQIDCTVTERRWHSSVLYVHLLRTVGGDTEH